MTGYCCQNRLIVVTKRLFKIIGARRSAILFLPAAALLAGCRREEIAVYRVPKEKEPEAAEVRNSEATPPQIQWKTPSGWEAQTPSGMSIASFLIPGEGGGKAQLSLMTLSGEGADELNLVNIVREKAGLGPLSDEEMARRVEIVSVGPAAAKLVDLTGPMNSASNTSPNRILVTVFPRGGITWFFKLAGDAGVVTAQKPVLLDFLKSVTFADSGGGTIGRGVHFASTNAKRIPTEPSGGKETADPLTGKPSWDVPAGWREVSPSELLLAKFLVGGNEGGAEITVSAFPGSTGGVLANVNRWRGQVGLAPVDEAEANKHATSLDVMGGRAMLVDVSGKNAKTGQPARLIGVIVPREGQTWFYKLMGNPGVAEREKSAFLKFVQSVRYPNV